MNSAGIHTSIALDLGSTRIKAGRFVDGKLVEVHAEDAPALFGDDPVRQFNPQGYLAATKRALDRLGPIEDGPLPVGIASQRSSFLLWERATGNPVTPVVSWQDRRAHGWCEANRRKEPVIRMITGLPLSAHYAGPKLASMHEENPVLWDHVRSGELLWGTLETYLVWMWTGGRVHSTDLTMAARTQMVDLREEVWAPRLCDVFGVPIPMLPVIDHSTHRGIALDERFVLHTTLADQAAGAVAALGRDTGTALVNLGTGGFVLVPTGREVVTAPGYLTAPILSDEHGSSFVLEGTINGAGSALDPYGPGPTELLEDDVASDAFCLPDCTGVGAPHWRAMIPFTLSKAAQTLDREAQRRVVLEGLVFRIREILDVLTAEVPINRVVMSGGLCREPFLPAALAACLQCPVEVLDQSEGTLLGVAQLAAGWTPAPEKRTILVEPRSAGRYLPAKFSRWRVWMDQTLAG